MKIFIPKYHEESGGAGRFLKTLTEKLSNTYTITSNIEDDGISLALINANSESYANIIRFKYKNLDTPIIHRLDGLNSHENRFFGDLSLSLLNRLTDFTIFQSNYSENSFKDIINHKNTRVIYNGSTFNPNPKEGYSKKLKIYSCYWSTGSWKKFDTLMNFIKSMKNDNSVEFYLIGNYQPYEVLLNSGIEIPKDIKNGNLKKINDSLFEKYPNVKYLGYLYPDESNSVISNMDYLFFPSENDSCPNTVVESLCCSIPVIYHRSGGTPELVGNSGISLEYFNEDYPSLVKYLSINKDRLKKEAESRRLELSIDVSEKKYIETIVSVIANKKKSRLIKKDIRVGWIMSYNSSGGSSRIVGYNLHNTMISLGIQSEILHYNEFFSIDCTKKADSIILDIKNKNINVLILQKVCIGEITKIVKWCVSHNVKVIYSAVDIIECDIYNQVDAVVACSEYFSNHIKEKYKKCKMVKYIDDGIETNPSLFKNTINKDNLTLGWFGNRDKVAGVITFKRNLNIEDPLIIISNNESANYTMGYGCEKPWSIDELTEIILREIDILIIPVDTSNIDNLVKSSNRLTLGMSLGIPTIASPIPSYKVVSSENKNSVFFADYNDTDTWVKHIDFLRNEKNRYIYGNVARQTVIDRFSLQTITKEWILFILEILNKDT